MSRIAVLFVALISYSAFGGSDVIALSDKEKSDVLRAADIVRHAILNQDSNALLAAISSSQGLGCTDDKFSHKRVRMDLRNPNSFLYIGLFDTSKFIDRCGSAYPANFSAKSEKDFFEHITAPKMEITFAKKNYATVTFQSTVEGYYPVEYSFRKERGQWKLVYGLIIGGCTCG